MDSVEWRWKTSSTRTYVSFSSVCAVKTKRKRLMRAGGDDLQLSTAPIGLQLADLETRPLVQGVSHQYSFKTTQAGLFVAVLVWTDPPAPPLVQQLLVNDLDLGVFTAQAGLQFGNGRFDSLGFAVPSAPPPSSQQRCDASPVVQVPDRVNTVERVMIQLNAAATISINARSTLDRSAHHFSDLRVFQVTGFQVPLSPQLYSLVVVGPSGMAVASAPIGMQHTHNRVPPALL
jgi:hypothetical protein